MSTQSQVLANQANAQHSTGPRTGEGKAAVSTNAITHGATSKQALMKGEDPNEYNRHLEGFRARFKPADCHESFLVQAMADACWRLVRMKHWELQIVEACQSANPFLDDEQFKKLSRAHRHIQSIERSYHRALRELNAVRKSEKSEKEPGKSEKEPAKSEITKQSQSSVKPFSLFENTWNGELNISLKNPLPKSQRAERL